MKSQFRLFLILEGSEEETFFEAWKSQGLISSDFEVTFRNVKGSGNVVPYYQSAFANGDYDGVFCVYDVDNRAQEESSPFVLIQKGLLEILGDPKAVLAVSLCTNPNILQMFLLCCDSLNHVALKTTSKKANTPLLRHYWPEIAKEKETESKTHSVHYYDAEGWQLRLLSDSICYGPYSFETMCREAKKLPLDYRHRLPASNLLPFLNALKEGDRTYFRAVQKSLEDSEEE